MPLTPSTAPPGPSMPTLTSQAVPFVPSAPAFTPPAPSVHVGTPHTHTPYTIHVCTPCTVYVHPPALLLPFTPLPCSCHSHHPCLHPHHTHLQCPLTSMDANLSMYPILILPASNTFHFAITHSLITANPTMLNPSFIINGNSRYQAYSTIISIFPIFSRLPSPLLPPLNSVK